MDDKIDKILEIVEKQDTIITERSSQDILMRDSLWSLYFRAEFYGLIDHKEYVEMRDWILELYYTNELSKFYNNVLVHNPRLKIIREKLIENDDRLSKNKSN